MLDRPVRQKIAFEWEKTPAAFCMGSALNAAYRQAAPLEAVERLLSISVRPSPKIQWKQKMVQILLINKKMFCSNLCENERATNLAHFRFLFYRSQVPYLQLGSFLL